MIPSSVKAQAPLENHGSYSAVKIGIGTPRQYLDLIADTGSSAVIVTHCACQKTNCFGHLGMQGKGALSWIEKLRKKQPPAVSFG